MKNVNLINGNCLEVLKTLADNSVDSVVTDPPYGIAFMNKKWDYQIPGVEIYQECLRVLKPGGHMLVACGTRTQHRMVVNIEDAGFEIRDVITWLYGSGFPKSMDISKAIDKEAFSLFLQNNPEKAENLAALKQDCANDPEMTRAASNYEAKLRAEAGALRETVGMSKNVRPDSERGNGLAHGDYGKVWNDTAPATDAAKQWAGWGTALKPACEFWTLARKPIEESTVAKNVLKFGTGAMNIDASRVVAEGSSEPTEGRFPANLILDESAGALLDEQSGIAASRFFYCAKAAKSERNAGCEELPEVVAGVGDERPSGQSMQRLDGREQRAMANHHPTVKPVKLMEYLCKLITPPGGTVLDPFMGSGTTGVAALKCDFSFVGIEMNSEYFEICKARTNKEAA